MPLFRKAARRDPLIIAMTGAALGSRVLMLCAQDESMPIDVAAKVGLSGRAVALAPDTAQSERIGRRAARRGVFVELGLIGVPLPHADHEFDLVIADGRHGGAEATAPLREAVRVLRPGGRIVVLGPAPRWWTWRAAPPAEAWQAAGALERSLLDAGFRAAREIGAREGVRFVEAARGV